MFHDFGYVALDILDVRSEDAGTYTVVARNALGEAQSETTMVVETRSSIDTTSMHRAAYDKAQRLEESKFQVHFFFPSILFQIFRETKLKKF